MKVRNTTREELKKAKRQLIKAKSAKREALKRVGIVI
jgi:hypothetical protein